MAGCAGNESPKRDTVGTVDARMQPVCLYSSLPSRQVCACLQPDDDDDDDGDDGVQNPLGTLCVRCALHSNITRRATCARPSNPCRQ